MSGAAPFFLGRRRRQSAHLGLFGIHVAAHRERNMRLMAWAFMATALAMAFWIMVAAAPEVSMAQRIVLSTIAPLVTLLLIFLTYKST